MINVQYKLVEPLALEAICESISLLDECVLVRPEMLSICKADIRYYFGMRDIKVLKKRLPLTLVHEACGIVLHDKSGRYKKGDKVILLPNIPGKEEKYDENYRLDSRFRSSRADGFMQEMISLPHTQVVKYENISKECAAITEFISVGVHAVESYMDRLTELPRKVAVWGDGGLGYVVCCLLKHFLPETHITVIGVHRNKLNMFQFVNERLTLDRVREEAQFDDVFECVGGQPSGIAISQMIDTIQPQGTIVLMGVSEEPVPVNTRMVLEKGITMLGRSRSRREDFEKAVEIMENDQKFADRMALLISEVVEVKDINDIHRAFDKSKIVDFKLVMDWKV